MCDSAISALKGLSGTHLMLQPHLDDLPFSIGHFLRSKLFIPASYQLWTVFGKEYFNIRGYPHDESTESILVQEELHWSALSGYPVRRLPLEEAGYRGVTRIRQLFLTARYHDPLLNYDALGYGNWQEVLEHMRTLIQPDVTCLWIPAGIGGHCDHLAVRQAVLTLVPESNVQGLIFYHELPYGQYSKTIEWENFHVSGFEYGGMICHNPTAQEAAHKEKEIALYYSQINERQAKTLSRETEQISVWLRREEI